MTGSQSRVGNIVSSLLLGPDVSFETGQQTAVPSRVTQDVRSASSHWAAFQVSVGWDGTGRDRCLLSRWDGSAGTAGSVVRAPHLEHTAPVPLLFGPCGE